MTQYTASDITVLEGLDPVRKRPGMYIGGVGATGLHHLVWEVLDNSVDEAMNGHASEITVTLHKDASSVTVSDNGRGIPVDKHPKLKKPAIEIIFSTLHAGGKFENANYKTSGGLHGVGASVVNALSTRLVASVKRGGAEYEIEFKAGVLSKPLKKKGSARGSGTTVYFSPDPKIFPKTQFSAETIRDRLEVVSYLHKGVRIDFVDETSGGKKQTFLHENGIADYLAKLVELRKARPAHEAPFLVFRDGEVQVQAALRWTESTDEHIKSYVNGIPTGSGGTHENGFRAGLTKAVRNYIETHNLLPRGVKIAPDSTVTVIAPPVLSRATPLRAAATATAPWLRAGDR